MNQHPLNTPVLFLVFNRPETTAKVFEVICQAQPTRLYVAADGPRTGVAGEQVRCKAVREIVSRVDWPCDVKTLFRDANLGCKAAVGSAVSWFFENEEMGIVLEDDCLPTLSFFRYCEELLEEYRADERIFLISGYNKQNTWAASGSDYFFSHLGGIWGWASWRRAWIHYDPDMPDVDEFIAQGHFVNLLGKQAGLVRQRQILEVLAKGIDTWDYQWGYARHRNTGLACVPAKSLIQNIGFGKGATHTLSDPGDNVTGHECRFPLKKPKFVVADGNYDRAFLKKPGWRRRLTAVMRALLGAGS